MIKLQTVSHYGNRIRYIFFKQLFDVFTASIHKTKKHTEFDESSELVILTMVQSKDIAMYLIAIKSFLRFITPNKVIVVCDKNVTDTDKITLKEHIQKIELYDVENFRNGRLPIGGTWERLTAISHFSKNYYVIQMDADTLTLCNPVDVINAIQQKAPFILGTDKFWDQKLTLSEMSRIAKSWVFEGSHHIQVFCESELNTLYDTTNYKYYIRGCSGFAGFPQKSISPDVLIHISSIFYDKLGKRWEEWGTEQFASNLILSNLKDVIILPLVKYTTPDNFNGENTFLHFIGYLRFNNFLYQKLAVNFIKNLK